MNFVVLAIVNDDEAIDDQMLDVMEIFYSLVFGTLPIRLLKQYLPIDTKLREPDRGLNVANPLDQSHDQNARERYGHLPENERLAVAGLPQKYQPRLSHTEAFRNNSKNKDL